MRFKIEYLTDCLNERSVFLTAFDLGPLEHTVERALEQAPADADGAQIRDLQEAGRIVWSERKNA